MHKMAENFVLNILWGFQIDHQIWKFSQILAVAQIQFFFLLRKNGDC